MLNDKQKKLLADLLLKYYRNNLCYFERVSYLDNDEKRTQYIQGVKIAVTEVLDSIENL